MQSMFTAENNRIYAITWFFFQEGASIGVWAALIPEVKQVHHISNTILGLILVAAVAGAIFSLPIAAYCNGKLGSAISTLIGSLASGVLMCVVGINGPLWLLVIGMICIGFGIAWVDISANTQAVLLEKHMNDHKLGLCHCLYAVGGLVGALIGGGLSTTNLSLFVNFLLISAAGVIPSIISYYYLFSYEEEIRINRQSQSNHAYHSVNSESLQDEILSPIENQSSSLSDVENDTKNIIINDDHVDDVTTIEIGRSTSISRKQVNATYLIIGLSLLGGLAYFGEGSIGDWSSIYLCDTLHASTLQGSFGFALFQLFVAFGRYYSDKLGKRYSRHILLQASGIIASVGLAIVVIAPILLSTISLYIAILGFGVTGIGLSIVAPIVISIAGSSIPSMEPSDAIAMVSSLTYVGVLIGPPMIGVLSGAFGELRYALLVDGGLLLLITVVATFLHRSLD